MNAPLAPEHLTPELHDALGRVTLDDKYTLDQGRAYMNGTQALVRLLMLQHERDHARRPQHRGLRVRLPRLAARRRRPDAVEGEEASRAAPHRVPAGPQRGHRGDVGVGLAAGQHDAAGQVRRRVRDVVRQGPGRRSLAATCSSTRTRPARRSTAACSRWPATTTRRSRRRCRTSPTTSSRPAASRCSSRRRCRSTSTSGCTRTR